MAEQARICAVITEPTVDAARIAMRRAASSAQMIELRLDYMTDLDFANPEALRPLLDDKPLPVIITCRAATEGGKQQIDDSIRLPLLVEGARLYADYCDIEAASYEQAAKLSPDPARLIVSYHNFTETPGDLESVYDSITRVVAAVYKIATRARSITDSLALFGLLERARRDGRDLIAVAMGYPGLITRVMGPSRGSFLTYCAVESGRESAAGQPSCEALNETFRLPEISRDTIVAGVIGDPVTQSASPEMHNGAARALGLDFVYLPLEVVDVPQFFKRFVRPESRELEWRLRGLSVTIPHKQEVLKQLDAFDEIVSRVSAANTVVIEGDRIKGYNTDVEGAIRPLEAACINERIGLGQASCAVIGAGGAARAVVYGLRKAGARVSIYARDPQKAAQFAGDLQVPVYLLDRLGDHDREIIINTTPVGMRGHSEGASVVSKAVFASCRIAYDLVYNPLETEFLRAARQAGCHTVSGLEMLVAQAALQFELWTGSEPPIDVMREAALKKLGAAKS